MSHPVIETFVELEKQAAAQWWSEEDRSAWRDELLRRKESAEILSLRNLISQGISAIEVAMWDQDLLRCFAPLGRVQDPPSIDDIVQRILALRCNESLGLFPRPGFWLCEAWGQNEEKLRVALEKARLVKALVIRCGFTTDQTDILLAADLGFSAIQIHAAELDLFQLQLLIETARDCRVCPIVSVENEAQMHVALQTDVPSIAVCSFPGDGFEQSLRFVQQALPRIPNNCNRILLTSSLRNTDILMYEKIGIQCILNFC